MSLLTINCHIHRFFCFMSPVFNWLIIYLNSLSPFGEGNGNSSIVAWKIPWTEDTGSGLQATVHGVTKSWTQLSD